MSKVPEMDDDTKEVEVTPKPRMRRKEPVKMVPLPEAGRGILISPGFR